MNLIFIVSERSIDFVSSDFGKSIDKAFSYSENLTVWDLDDNKRLLEVYCEEDNFNKVEEELDCFGIFDWIPNSRDIFNNLRLEYDEILFKRIALNEESKLKQEIKTYLKIKNMIDNKEIQI